MLMDSPTVTLKTSPSPPLSPPDADFDFFCPDLDCFFTDRSSDSDGSIVGWSWDFGDGRFDSDANPIHDFSPAGTYTVTLTVTDNDGLTDEYARNVTVSDF